MGHLLFPGERQNKFEDCFVRRDVAANAIQELYGPSAVQCEANVFHELSIAHFDDEKGVRAFCEAPEIRGGERVQRDGS